METRIKVFNDLQFIGGLEKFNNPHNFEIDEDRHLSFLHITEHGQEVEILRDETGQYLKIPEGFIFLGLSNELKDGQKLKVVNNKRLVDAFDRINKEYYDRNSNHYKDNQRFEWAVKVLNKDLDEEYASLLQKLDIKDGVFAVLKKK